METESHARSWDPGYSVETESHARLWDPGYCVETESHARLCLIRKKVVSFAALSQRSGACRS